MKKPVNPPILLTSLLGILLTSLAVAPVAAACSARTTETTKSESLAISTQQSIVDIASTNDAFTTLTAALQAADLVGLLDGDEPFTVFAPTDAAFANLPEGTLDALLLPENRGLLVEILTYHVVPGRVTADALASGMVATAGGESVQVSVGESQIAINQATVIQADIPASNGVIHVIDQVLLPPAQ
ncbi:MAG: fasciclin domain-containing protein [Pseudomonadota bacterium]